MRGIDFIRDGIKKKNLSKKQLSLTADRLDTGADWRVLALPQ